MLANQALLDALPCGVIGWDSQDRVGYANPAAVALLHQPSAALAGAPREQVAAWARQAGLALVPVTGDGAGGRPAFSLLPAPGPAGALTLAQIAHEVRQPLAAAAAVVQLARRRPEQALAFLDQLGAELRRIQEILDAAVLLERYPAGPPERCPVGELLAEGLAACQARSREQGVQVQVKAAPDLAVAGHRRLLYRVVLNLVTNALAAMPAGGTLSLQAGRDGPWVRLDVADTGPGFPPGVLERLYQPFVSTREGRPGLGLLVSRHLAAAHGGRLEVQSEPGRGACASVWLPPWPGPGALP